MKIYFCGSIRGGREDAALYADIIAHLQKKHTVLTEHVGKKDLEKTERQLSESFIYDRDTAWLRDADAVVAECTRPSLGVGYELAYAESRHIPCYVFYRDAVSALSAMIAGDPYFEIFRYDTLEQITGILDRLL